MKFTGQLAVLVLAFAPALISAMPAMDGDAKAVTGKQPAGKFGPQAMGHDQGLALNSEKKGLGAQDKEAGDDTEEPETSLNAHIANETDSKKSPETNNADETDPEESDYPYDPENPNAIDPADHRK